MQNGVQIRDKPPISTTIREAPFQFTGRRRPQIALNTFAVPDVSIESSIPPSTRGVKRSNPSLSVIPNTVHNVKSLERIQKATQAMGYKSGASKNSSISSYSSRAGNGQQFAVASVGNNGMLYLRYTPNIYCLFSSSSVLCIPLKSNYLVEIVLI